MIGTFGYRSKWILGAVLALLVISIVACAVSSDNAIDKLKAGNDKFCRELSDHPNCSLERVKVTSHGQNPFAVH